MAREAKQQACQQKEAADEACFQGFRTPRPSRTMLAVSTKSNRRDSQGPKRTRLFLRPPKTINQDVSLDVRRQSKASVYTPVDSNDSEPHPGNSMWRTWRGVACATALLGSLLAVAVCLQLRVVRLEIYEETIPEGSTTGPQSRSGDDQTRLAASPFGLEGCTNWSTRHTRYAWCSALSPSSMGSMEGTNCTNDRSIPFRVCRDPWVRGFRVNHVSLPGSWHMVDNLVVPHDLLISGEHIDAYVGHAVDQLGAAIAFPPLHMHHIHIQAYKKAAMFETNPDFETLAENDPDLNVHFLQTHVRAAVSNRRSQDYAYSARPRVRPRVDRATLEPAILSCSPVLAATRSICRLATVWSSATQHAGSLLS